MQQLGDPVESGKGQGDQKTAMGRREQGPETLTRQGLRHGGYRARGRLRRRQGQAEIGIVDCQFSLPGLGRNRSLDVLRLRLGLDPGLGRGMVEPQPGTAQVQHRLVRVGGTGNSGPQLQRQVGGGLVIPVAQVGLVGRQVEFESHGLGGNHHLAIHPAGPSQEPHLPLVGQQAVVNPEIGHLHRRQFQAEVEVGLAAAHLDVQQGLEAMAGEEGQRRDLVRLGRRAGGLRQQGGLDLVEADHEVRLIRVVGIDLEFDGAVAVEGMAGEGHRQLVGLDDQVGAGEQLAVGKDQAPAQAALALEVQPRHVAGQQG